MGTGEGEAILSKLTRAGANPYLLLGVAPEAPSTAIRGTGEALLAAIGRALQGELPQATRRRLEDEAARVAAAVRVLAEPTLRLDVDVKLGNPAGVIRCLAEGVRPETLAEKRRALLATYPTLAERLDALLAESLEAERDGDRRAALAAIDEGLRLDPLSPELHARRRALRET